VDFPFLTMNITVSLETAKRLRAAGWEQEDSSFYWGRFDPPKRRHLEDGTIVDIPKEEAEAMSYSWYYYNEENMPYADEDHNSWAAPTAEEILRELPNVIIHTPEGKKHSNSYRFQCAMTGKTESGMQQFWCAYSAAIGSYDHVLIKMDTLANAAAEMWIYLSENGLLSEPLSE